jgi:hypothetical protein
MYAAAAANPITWTEVMRLTNAGVLTLAQAGSLLGLGTTPALTGAALRLSNAAILAAVRNFANTADVNLLGVSTAGSDYAQVAPAQSLTLGLSAPAVGATTGFPYLPAIAGVPTGVPTAIAGYAPVAVDSTDNRLYFYSGAAWQAMFPTPGAATGVLNQQPIGADITNTAVETDLYRFTIPANTVTTGRALRFRLMGDFLKNSAGATTTWRIKLGATVLFLNTPTEADNAVRRARWVEVYIHQYGIGTQLTWYRHYSTEGTALTFGAVVQDNVAAPMGGAVYSTEDMTVAKDFAITIQFSAANANLAIKRVEAMLFLE